jgi:hypothetical protein
MKTYSEISLSPLGVGDSLNSITFDHDDGLREILRVLSIDELTAVCIGGYGLGLFLSSGGLVSR